MPQYSEKRLACLGKISRVCISFQHLIFFLSLAALVQILFPFTIMNICATGDKFATKHYC